MRVAATFAALVTCLALAGCNDNGDGEADETGSSSPAPTTPSASATGSAGPVPATGPAMSYDGFTFRLPEGWAADEPGADGLAASPADESDRSSFSATVASAGSVADERELAPIALDVFRTFTPKGRRLPFTEWAGKPAYHLAGSGTLLGGDAVEFGIVEGGKRVRIYFEFDGTNPRFATTPAEREALIASVEASWEWT